MNFYFKQQLIFIVVFLSFFLITHEDRTLFILPATIAITLL